MLKVLRRNEAASRFQLGRDEDFAGDTEDFLKTSRGSLASESRKVKFSKGIGNLRVQRLEMSFPLASTVISLALAGIGVVVTRPPGQRTQRLSGVAGVLIT